MLVIFALSAGRVQLSLAREGLLIETHKKTAAAVHRTHELRSAKRLRVT